MEIDTTINISILISACLAILGWMVNNYYKRKHEIAKKRLEYRLETLHSFIPVYLSLAKSQQPFIDDPKLNEKFNDASIKFQLYGLEDEIKLLNSCISDVEMSNTKSLTSNLNELIELIKNRIRKELELPRLK